MTRMLSLAAALAFSLSATTAFAQTAPAAPAAPAVPAAPAPKMAPKAAAKPRTPQSVECSKKADAQNIHGKPRKAFMSKCKAGKA